jgi:histidinol-phosphatase (PHP family)
MRQSPRETYPHPDIIRRYYRLGGRRLTVGSDSHTARDVGRGVSEALRLAEEIGFTHVQRFRAREAESVPIRSLMAG